MNTKNLDNKILIIKTSALGDIFQCFSVLRFLKSHLDSVVIDWVVEERFAEVLRAHPDVRRVLTVNTREWKQKLFSMKTWKEIGRWGRSLRAETYASVFDLQGNMKSGLITTMARSCEKIGWSFRAAPEWPSALFLTKRCQPNLQLSVPEQYLALVQGHFGCFSNWKPSRVMLDTTENERAWVESIVSRVSSLKLMICIGSRWENKKLSQATWQKILDHVTKTCDTTFFFVSGTEKEIDECARLAAHFKNRGVVLPRMSVPVWQRVMDQMDGVLTVDSSALHLAATTSAPTFAFFGPSAEQAYRPLGKKHQAFQGLCPYGVTFSKRCSKLRTCSTGACLKDLTEEKLIFQIDVWLQGIKRDQ